MAATNVAPQGRSRNPVTWFRNPQKRAERLEAKKAESSTNSDFPSPPPETVQRSSVDHLVAPHHVQRTDPGTRMEVARQRGRSHASTGMLTADVLDANLPLPGAREIIDGIPVGQAGVAIKVTESLSELSDIAEHRKARIKSLKEECEDVEQEAAKVEAAATEQAKDLKPRQLTPRTRVHWTLYIAAKVLLGLFEVAVTYASVEALGVSGFEVWPWALMFATAYIVLGEVLYQPQKRQTPTIITVKTAAIVLALGAACVLTTARITHLATVSTSDSNDVSRYAVSGTAPEPGALDGILAGASLLVYLAHYCLTILIPVLLVAISIYWEDPKRDLYSSRLATLRDLKRRHFVLRSYVAELDGQLAACYREMALVVERGKLDTAAEPDIARECVAEYFSGVAEELHSPEATVAAEIAFERELDLLNKRYPRVDFADDDVFPHIISVMGSGAEKFGEAEGDEAGEVVDQDTTGVGTNGERTSGEDSQGPGENR